MLLQGNYDWSRIEAETMQNLSCTYMGEGSGECDIVAANASRMCNDIGKWEEPDVGKCLSSVTETLCNIRNVSTKCYDCVCKNWCYSCLTLLKSRGKEYGNPMF